MKAAIVEGTLAATMREALRLRDQMRADGATEVELAQALEQTVRAAWLFTRAWKYLCQACDDTGAVRHVCTPSQRCQGISTWIDNPHDTPGKYRRLCATSPDAEYERSEEHTSELQSQSNL